jgi:hypothetical protein
MVLYPPRGRLKQSLHGLTERPKPLNETTLPSDLYNMTYGEANPQRTHPIIPGLRGIENLADAEKTARIAMIANDVIAAITQIADMKTSGVLKDRNTRPIDDMIDMFGSTDSAYRRELECLLRKRERSLRALSQRHKEDVQELVRSAAVGFSRLRRRADDSEERLEAMKRQLVEKELQYLGALARNERQEDQLAGRTQRMRHEDGEARDEKKLNVMN